MSYSILAYQEFHYNYCEEQEVIVCLYVCVGGRGRGTKSSFKSQTLSIFFKFLLLKSVFKPDRHGNAALWYTFSNILILLPYCSDSLMVGLDGHFHQH